MKLNAIIKKFADETFLKFIIVGVINTLVGAVIMFGLYNIFGVPVKIASASNYILTSILSFFLNKYFTFSAKETSVGQVLRFALNILVCYLLAYGIAEKLALKIFDFLGKKLRDNLSMLIGMGLFTILNYVGQRFFAFKKADGDKDE